MSQGTALTCDLLRVAKLYPVTCHRYASRATASPQIIGSTLSGSRGVL